MKVKDFTISEILEIASFYNKRCEHCPLYEVEEYKCIHCEEFCESSEEDKIKIKENFNQEIDLINFQKEYAFNKECKNCSDLEICLKDGTHCYQYLERLKKFNKRS